MRPARMHLRGSIFKTVFFLFLWSVFQPHFNADAITGMETGTGDEELSEAPVPDATAILSPDREVTFFTIRGHYKNLFTGFTSENFLDKETDHFQKKYLAADLNRLRLSPEIKTSENFLLHADMDNEVFAANYAGSRTFDAFWFPSDFNDLFDPVITERFSGDGVYRFNLHRFYAKAVTGNFTITMGRQLIRFGSGRLWNPLDILNPITPTFVEGPEDQKGIDAFRMEYYPGVATEIAIVYAPKRINDELDGDIFANKNTNLISRLRTTIDNTDLAVLGGRVTRRYLGGIDFSTILWDGMLRGSFLLSFPDRGNAYGLGSVGYEYTFRNGLYFLAEYFYNQNALNRNGSLLDAYSESLVFGMNEDRFIRLANQFLTFNRHYSGIVLGYDISPLLRGDIFAIADIEGRGIYVSPSLKYNLFQNLDISIAGMLGSVFSGASVTSDFDSLEDHPLFFASLVWYF